eukprot:115846-Rhodomonas_salina.2
MGYFTSLAPRSHTVAPSASFVPAQRNPGSTTRWLSTALGIPRSNRDQNQHSAFFTRVLRLRA